MADEGDDVVIDSTLFYQRLERLQSEWLLHKGTNWSGADALCIMFGVVGADDGLIYSKSSAFHLYMFGHELSNSVIVITRNSFCFMGSAKKCSLFERDISGKNPAINVQLFQRTKDEGLNREYFHTMANVCRKSGGNSIGSVYKDEYAGGFIKSWLDFLDQSNLQKVEISAALGLFFSVKDAVELDLCKRAAVLTNKIMKHGFVQEMENILDNDVKITHLDVSNKISEIINDPSKINVKVSAESVDVCYDPIVQSGGVYDIKVSALSDENILRGDVILCSLGSRYKNYCANVSRTFMVDASPKIEKLYGTLLSTFNACLEKMVPGTELKEVYLAAQAHLKRKDPAFLAYLPKSLGFAIGLEFRDSTMLLNATNTRVFTAGMVFNLSVGLHNVPLPEVEDKPAGSGIDVVSLLLADVVGVQADGMPEIFTKISKEFSDVSYNIAEKDNEADGGDDDGGGEGGGARRSARGAEARVEVENATARRVDIQKELMKKRLAEARKQITREFSGDTAAAASTEVTELDARNAKDLQTYQSTAEYPRDVNVNRIRVDLDKEALLVPINGRLVPFHISTIKNMTQPDPDMRINFYIPGAALGKEVAKNMQHLVFKYGGKSTFIKELTFRASDGKNLSTVYQQFQELRRRVRQREQKVEQEKDLVQQTKLIRIKDQRVPRLQEVTVRPQISGRKCIGTLEAHQNGMRFTSSKAEVLDVMYSNIKHAIFQPCDRTAMVLFHCHLVNPILVGKKSHKDVQFFTEVGEASLNLDVARRSNYDPDELEEEERERELRRRLNTAFKEFCSKVEKVAAHYEFNLQIDVPFKKSGFVGNWSRDMVTMTPTTNCLVNLVEWPPFVLTLSEVEHAHFERVTYATKAFDLTFIFKNWDVLPRTINSIDLKYMEIIEDWLNLVEITFTKGPRSMNWVDVMKLAKSERQWFYDDVDEDGVKNPAPGWLTLSVEGSDEEEDEEGDGDSSFSEDEDDDDESSEEDSESDYDEDEESEDDDDDEDGEDDEEAGQTWEELEREALKEDKLKRSREETEDMHNQANKRRAPPPSKGGRR